MKKRLMMLVIGLVVIEYLSAQTFKRIRRDDLTIRPACTVTSLSNGYLKFSYVFESDPTSRQSMHRVIVELNDEWLKYGGTVRNVVPPKEKDWGEFPSVGEKMRWRAQYDTTGLDILEHAPRSAILPGGRLSFSFETRGIPGIGLFLVAGWARWFYSREEVDSLVVEGYPEGEWRAIDDKFFKGVTLVRKSPLIPFVPLVFLDTLISYKHQAVALGWIVDRKEDDHEKNEEDDNGIVAKLDKRLGKARAELVKGDSSKARKELEKFVKKVEELYKESQEHEKKQEKEEIVLTSEGYALLKYNAEYLIDRLPKKEKGGKD